MKEDGVAEVARYRYERSHHGIEVRGKAALVITHEVVHPRTYVRTRSEEEGVSALRISLVRDVPWMNWDVREHVSVMAASDHRPMRLSLTGDEWVGVSTQEWTVRGDRVDLFWRSRVEGSVPLAGERTIPSGYYFYEQMPLIVRSGNGAAPSRQVRVLPPQSATLAPMEDAILINIERVEEDVRVETPAGEFLANLIEVTPASPHARFPGPERYWLEKETDVLLKAERHEVIAWQGIESVEVARYTLLDHRRVAYWERALPPATSSMPDRERATYDGRMELDGRKVRALLGKRDFAPTELDPVASELPAEYLSDARGERALRPRRRKKGGWYYDSSREVMGTRGGFVPDVPPSKSLPEREGFHE